MSEKQIPVTVMLKPETNITIEKLADEKGLSKSSFLRSIILEYLKGGVKNE